MENHNQVSNFSILFLIALIAVSHFDQIESKCIKRNKQVTSKSSNTEQSSPPTPSEKATPSLQKPSKSASDSVSVTESSDTDSNNERFGDMLKQVVGQLDTNSPILNIPKPTVTDPKIIKFCKTTDYPDLCESTVSNFITDKNDAVAMLEMVIKACVHYTQLARAAAKTLSISPMFAKIKTRFTDIDEYYVDALDNLQDAENAIKAKDIATVNINLSAALDDYGAYEDDWGETSPMADFDMKLTHMASNCLAISTLVKF